MSNVVSLEGIRKTYHVGFFRRSVPALRGLDLIVRAGSAYAFLGVNGAGKTTTFRILLGLLRSDAGRGTLLGAPLGDRRIRRRLGFLPELPAYYPHLTGGEVLRFARGLTEIARDDGADRRLLEELGIGEAWLRPVRRLSKGQLQRVGLAQALVHDPELLILDEPMSGLDPIARALVKERLRREHAAGRTLLLSMHVLADAETIVDRVGLLAEGRLAVEADARSLLARAVQAVTIEGEGDVDPSILASMPQGSELRAGTPWTMRLVAPTPFQVDACLRWIISGGASVHDIETEREDLETFFVRSLRALEEVQDSAAGPGEEVRCAS